MRTYRVTVRGRFEALGDEAKLHLLADLGAHDALNAQFSGEGTFTYDKALNAFSFRYVITDEEDNPDEAADNVHIAAELKATDFLESNGYGYKALKVSSTSVDDMVANTRRLQ